MLGEIKTVPLRTIWKNEAYDFTPWLSENLDQLNKAIGLDLELDSVEVSVGPFSADILAKDTATGKYVVIENQLEKTNHDHLGKCITYSSVLDASAVIWIASTFTDEHKKALDWLNDHTSDEIAFYGLQVELWKIDNSQPAVRFNVISEPNNAVRQATHRKELGELTETKQTQLKFWTEFKESLDAKNKISSSQTPKPQNWYDVALGKSGVHLSNTFNTWTNEIAVRVYIRNKQADEWMLYFLSKKEEIESKIGTELNWDPNPENRDKIITLSKYFDLEDEKSWKDAIRWMTEYTIKFQETFSRVIQEYNIITK